MNIVGLTFDRELKGYVSIKTFKVSKWIDTADFSLAVVLRLAIEHNLENDEFRKLKEFYVYFKEEDLDSITIKEDAIGLGKVKKKGILDNKNRRKELEERISPLGGFIDQIKIENIYLEEKNDKKRIKIVLEDYVVTEESKKRNIKFLFRLGKRSINILNENKYTERNRWYYDCLIEPYLVQTLRWDKREFMPPIGFLEVWLQIPKNLYGSLSAINIQPVSQFEQMFLLGREISERFQKARQPLAQEDTLCINWTFADLSISSPPEEIEVTCGLIQFTEEEGFVRRFGIPEESILVLREISHTCKVKTLDFNYIISKVHDRNIKRVLEIFNTMVFQKNLRTMKENLDLLLPLLEHFRIFPYGEEFFIRYDIFHNLILCKSSEDFFSVQIFSKLKKIQELEDILDPEYIVLMEDLNDLVELAKKSRYREDVLSKINSIDYEWSRRSMYPDRYILIDILSTWKNIVEKEYEERVPQPQFKRETKSIVERYLNQAGLRPSITLVGSIVFSYIFRKIRTTLSLKKIEIFRTSWKHRIALSGFLVLIFFIACKHFGIMSAFWSFVGSAAFGVVFYLLLESS